MIPNTVQTIGNYAFFSCSKLNEIVLLAATAPSVQSQTFQFVKQNGVLRVPTGATGYDMWMSVENCYLGHTTRPSKKLPGSNYHGYGLKQKKPRKCGAFLLTYSTNI